MGSEKKTKKQQKENLSDTFNKFAAKAVKDFPKLKDKFIVYSKPSDSWHGTAPKNSATEALRDELLNDADEEDETGGTVAFAYYYRRHYMMAYVHKSRFRSMTSADDTPTQETFAIMQHELAHLVAPGGNTSKHTDNFCESVADVFSFVCQAHEFGKIDRTLKASIWLGTKDLILNGETVHYTTPVLAALTALADRHDLSKLNPVEAANLAYRISLEHGYSDTRLRRLARIFKPVTKHHPHDLPTALKTCAEIMLADHGRDTPIVFEIAKTMLEPFLEQRMDILHASLSSKEIKRLKFEGRLWDRVRTEIKKHAAIPHPQKNAAEIEASDSFLLGKFDRSPKKLITPARYEKKENQFRIRLERRKYIKAAKAG